MTGRSANARPDALTPGRAPRWYEVVLALALVGLLVAVAAWLLVEMYAPEAASVASDPDWRGGTRALGFLAAMVVAAALALLIFLVVLLVRSSKREPIQPPGFAASSTSAHELAELAPRGAAASPTHSGSEIPVSTPGAVRLLGLALLAVAVLVLAWTHLSPAERHGLMLRMLYPAGFVVAIVLLFDKASRAWQLKSGTETVREWLLCDWLTFLLLLGFVNLSRTAAAEAYSAFFWDLLFIASFFVAFWILDRKVTRYRFLVAYGYIALLPLLLAIWNSVNGVTAPEAVSWWSTTWPFLVAGIVFFVLEIIALLSARGPGSQTASAIKDGVCAVVYAILLLVAIPPGA